MQEITLGQIATFEMGQSPDSRYVSDTRGGMPFLQGNAEFGVVHPQPRLWCRQPKKTSQIGDCLISVRAPVGALNLADQAYCIGRGLAAVRFHGANPRYGAHLLAYFAPQLRRKAQGTTFEAVGKDDLATLVVNHFSDQEQARIAEVLDTLDEAIRRSEEVREKRSQLLDGLAQQLMTCGVDEDGQIRDASQAPNGFEQTSLGRFPRSWQIRSIGDLGTTITGSTPPSSVPGVWGDDLPFVTPSEVTEGGAVLCASRSVSAKGKAFVSPLPPSTLLTVCIGSTLGKMALTHEECATNQQINATIPGPGVDGTFLEYAIRLQIGKLLALAGLQAVPIVNRTQFEGLRVAVAPPEEQRRIGDIIRAQQALIHEEEVVIAGLQSLKSGLTSDLLTGRVRTSVVASTC